MRLRQIGLSAIVSYAAIAFNIIAGLIYTPWMIRTIGDSNYGVYSLALSVLNLFLIDFGIGASVSKFLSGFYARDDEEKVAPFLGTVYKLFLFLSLFILLLFTIVYFQIDVIYTKLTTSEIYIFKRLFIVVALYSVISFPFQPLNGILIAKEKFFSLKICNLLQKMMTVFLIVLMLSLGGDVFSLVLANSVSSVIFILVKLYIIRRSQVRTSFKGAPPGTVREIFGYSVWMTLVQISQLFIFNIAPTILAVVMGSFEITIFSLAATIEGYIFSIGDALSGMFMPEVARNYEQSNFINKTETLMIQIGRIQLYIIGLLILGIICVGGSFVQCWMGSGYEQVYLCIVLLAIPSLIDVPMQIGRTAILISGNIRWQAMVYVLMAILNVALSLPLSSFLGVYGTALAVCIAYIVRSIGLLIILSRKIHINIGSFIKNVYLTWIIPALITLFLGLTFELLIPKGGWGALFIKICGISFIYFTLIYFISFNCSERNRILSILRVTNR